MRKFHWRDPMTIGLLANALFLFTNGIDGFPELVKGLLLGVALTGMLLGLYGRNHDLQALKLKKREMYQKFFGHFQ